MTTEQLEAEYEKHRAAYTARLDELKTAAAIDADQLAFDLWTKQSYWHQRCGDALRTNGQSERKYN